jgi:hypothetical protein
LKFLCSVLKHVPDRSRAWFDDYDFRAPCARCGLPLIKDLARGWRRFDGERDEIVDATRRPRPEHHKHRLEKTSG